MSPEVKEKFDAYLKALRESDEAFYEYLSNLDAGGALQTKIEKRRALAQTKMRQARQELDVAARKP